MKTGRQPLPALPWRLVAAFLLLSALVLILIAILFSVLEQRQREGEFKQLSAMAQLKVGEIEGWLAERRLDAEVLVATPGLRDDARSFLERHDLVAGSRLKHLLESSRAIDDAISIELTDPGGRSVLLVGPRLHTVEVLPELRDRRTGDFRTLFVDLHRDGADAPIHLSLVVALVGDGGPAARPIGYLRLNINPEQHLYPLLRKWPLPGNSGETLLIRREGDDVVYLNDMRHRPDTALNLRLPLATPGLAAAQALRQGEGVYSGLDYRQSAVLSAFQPVAGTPWILLAKEDETEVLGDLVRLRTLSFAVILTAMLFSGLLWWQIWRRQALQARQALETQLGAIAATVPGVLCSFRLQPDGHASFPYASPAIVDLYGLTPEQLAEDAAPVLALMHPDDLEQVRQSIAESARSMALWRGEFRVKHPHHGEIWVEGCSAPQHEADGGILWHGYLQDVTARRRAEDALRQAEERYRTLLDNIPGAAFRCEIGPPSRIVFLSDGAKAITGYPASELVHPDGVRWASAVVLPDDKPLVKEAVRRAIETRSLYEVEYRVRRADGDIRWLHEKGRAVYRDSGEAEWIDGVIVDISARIEADTALQASRERWRQLAEAMPQLVWTCMPDGVCDYVNRRWIDYTGLPADERLGHAWLAVLHPEDRGRLATAWNRAVAGSGVLDGEFRLRRNDGEYRWFKMRALPVRDEANRVVKWYGSNTDIQDLKEFEAALHRSLLRQQGLHQLDRAILEASTPEEVAAKGLAHLAALLPFRFGNARVFDFENGTATVLALRRAEGSNYEPKRQISLADFGHEDLKALKEGRVRIVGDLGALPDRSPFLDQLYERGIRSYVRLPLMAEGRLFGSLNLVSESPAHFGSGEVELARPVADVLAIAMQQASLRQHLVSQAAMLEVRVAERTAELARMKDQAEAASLAKSQFLANMSHELRTPLNSLLILSRLLADNAQSNLTPEQVGFARVIHDAGNDLLSLINDILDLSKIESGRAVVKTDDTPIQALLDYIERIFRPQAQNKGLRFELASAPHLPPSLLTDSDHLRPILRNLVANAIKFTQEGSVSLQVFLASTGWSPRHPVLSTAPTVFAFKVADTGVGIPAEKLHLIFEAFEQADASPTRRFGGTGLGLHIAQTNAELLGGELTVESSPGRGSVFTLFLPLRYAGPVNLRGLPAPERSDTGRAAPGKLAGCKVLIAEPDLRSRISIAAALEQHGLRTVAAAGGEEALERLASDPDIKAVIMDVALPDMDGHDVLRAIRERRRDRDLPVIALTTGRLPEDRSLCLAAGCTECLAKPVHASQLLGLLRACLKY